ncbi:hypothetical protein VNO77_11386 [Canavalia gladiata]|uniref:Uncharacterized protein n=1 Tax=Canavalia gladiata TaxID=3824 RepID=A0AAN9MI10_CANGL
MHYVSPIQKQPYSVLVFLAYQNLRLYLVSNAYVTESRVHASSSGVLNVNTIGVIPQWVFHRPIQLGIFFVSFEDFGSNLFSLSKIPIPSSQEIKQKINFKKTLHGDCWWVGCPSLHGTLPPQEAL